MRLLKKIIVFILAVLVFSFVLGTLYVKFYGKQAIENALTAALERRFEIGAIEYTFPLGFSAEKISLEGLMKAKHISAQFSCWSLLGRKRIEVVYASVKEPIITIERRLPSAQGMDGSLDQTAAVVSSKMADLKQVDFEIFIRKLFIEDGQVKYFQESTQNNFEFEFKELQMNIEDLLFPVKPQKSSFNFVAKASQDIVPFGDSKVGGSGWVNVANRDMQAQLMVKEPDGRVALKADVVSQNNNMRVSGDVKIGNVFHPAPAEGSAEPKSSSVNDLIVDSLSTMGLEIGAKFYFDTKMDDFRVSAIKFEGSVLAKPTAKAEESAPENTSPAPEEIIAPK